MNIIPGNIFQTVDEAVKAHPYYTSSIRIAYSSYRENNVLGKRLVIKPEQLYNKNGFLSKISRLVDLLLDDKGSATNYISDWLTKKPVIAIEIPDVQIGGSSSAASVSGVKEDGPVSLSSDEFSEEDFSLSQVKKGAAKVNMSQPLKGTSSSSGKELPVVGNGTVLELMQSISPSSEVLLEKI